MTFCLSALCRLTTAGLEWVIFARSRSSRMGCVFVAHSEGMLLAEPDARENMRRSVPLTPGTAGEGPVTF